MNFSNALLLVVSLSALSCGGLRGSGQRATDTRTVDAFSMVTIEDGFQATIARGEPSISIEADDNLLSSIETTVVDGRLVVREKDNTWFVSLSPVKVTIFNPTLTSVAATGGAHVTAAATPTDTFVAGATGGSELKLTGVEAQRVNLDASGGSRVTASGHATLENVTATGGSTILAGALEVSEATLVGSGGSTITLHVANKVTGDVSGGSTATVSGGAKSEVTSSGGSAISAQ